jgi:hypothetical protein
VRHCSSEKEFNVFVATLQLLQSGKWILVCAPFPSQEFGGWLSHGHPRRSGRLAAGHHRNHPCRVLLAAMHRLVVRGAHHAVTPDAFRLAHESRIERPPRTLLAPAKLSRTGVGRSKDERSRRIRGQAHAIHDIEPLRALKRRDYGPKRELADRPQGIATAA